MEFSLHEHQRGIFDDDTRFKVVAAGRRFGKSYLAAIILYIETAKSEKLMPNGELIDLTLEEVYYVAPTYEQGKKILWGLLKSMGDDLIDRKYEQTGEIFLINGRRMSIKGADRPDSLRGIGLSYVVLDEYAFMKEEVWDVILEPALARTQGGALFIGTPDGKNHFYKMWMMGMLGEGQVFEYDGQVYHHDIEYKSWAFKTIDSPFISEVEVEKKRKRLSAQRFRQEYEASFESGGGIILRRDMFPVREEEPHDGDWYVTADLAGFDTTQAGRKIVRRSNHAISIVKAHKGGWWVKKIEAGRWGVRETAIRLVRAYQTYRPIKFGIERTISLSAVLPYMEDEMSRLNIWFDVEPMSHGNQKKPERIEWALQGRAEQGRIQLAPGDWNSKFFDEVDDFPSPLAPNDMIDALSYVDQISLPYFDGPDSIDEWEALDDIAAY
jgi:hypothetical protein